MNYVHSKMERLCKFCQKVASYEPLESMERFRIKVFYCHPCKAEYLYTANKQEVPGMVPSSVSLYATVNKKMYRWTVRADQCGQLWWVKQPGIPGKKINEDMQPILYLPELETVELTPNNIVTKLESWLPFL